MNFNTFFLLYSTPIILITSIIALILTILYIKRKYPQLWVVFQAKILRNKTPAKDFMKNEAEESKTQRYETFEDFLQDCPKYQIDSGAISNLFRDILKSLGARYQQYIFIDKASPKDKTAWLRTPKNGVLIHDKGTYFTPWESEKEIVYFDVVDSRPLIDMTKEMDWQNGDMCAETVTALTNSNNMQSMDGNKNDAGKYILYILIAVVAIVIMAFLIMRNMDMYNAANQDMLKQIINQTSRTRI